MKNAFLYRTQAFESCTRGILVIPSEGKVFFTLEPPWKGNQPNVSCIPRGKYKCVWHKSPKYGWVYKVTEVEGRSSILMHPGNTPNHTLGCILIGSRFGTLGGGPAILSSKPAVRELFELMDKQDFTLEIS